MEEKGETQSSRAAVLLHILARSRPPTKTTLLDPTNLERAWVFQKPVNVPINDEIVAVFVVVEAAKHVD